jgi:hypothetical protein
LDFKDVHSESDKEWGDKSQWWNKKAKL